MDEHPLIGGSILAVVLLILGSFGNVVGYQTVQSSNQKIITNEDNPKEMLFQTIVDMVNNKEIQKVILGSEMTGKQFYNSEIRFSVFNPPILTEKFLKHLYAMGMILFGTPSISTIQSLIKQHQVFNQAMKKEISLIIEKDATLKAEIMRLSYVNCDCKDENTTQWHFPFICIVGIVFFAYLVNFCTELHLHFLEYCIQVCATIFVDIFNCYPLPPMKSHGYG